MLNKISNENLKSCVTFSASLTPFRVTLLLVIRNYLKSKNIYDKMLENNNSNKRNLIIAFLNIMQSEDMTLYETLNVFNSLCSDLAKETLINLNNLCTEKQTYKLYKFLTNFENFMEELNIVIPKSSILYLYIKNSLANFRQYWFEDMIKLHHSLCLYYNNYFNNKAIKIKNAKPKFHELLVDFMQNNDYNSATKYVRKCAEMQMTLPYVDIDDEAKNENYWQYQDFSRTFSMGSYNMAVVQQKFGYSEMASHHLKEALQIIYSTRDVEMLDKCQTFLQTCQLAKPSTFDSFIFKQEKNALKLHDSQNDEILQRKICYSENSHIIKASILRAQYLVETNGDPENIIEMLLMSPEKGCESLDAISLKTKLECEPEDAVIQQTTRLIFASTMSGIYGLWPEHSNLLVKLAHQTINYLPPSDSQSQNVKAMALCQEARILHLKGEFQARDIIANDLGFPNPYKGEQPQLKRSSKYSNCLEGGTKLALLELYMEYGLYQTHPNTRCETGDVVKNLLQQLRNLDKYVALYWQAQYNFVFLQDYETAYKLSKSLSQSLKKTSMPSVQGRILSSLQYQYLRVKTFILKSQILIATKQLESAKDYLIEGLAICYDFNLYALATLVIFNLAQVKVYYLMCLLKMGRPSDITEAFILSNFTRAYMSIMSYGSMHSTEINRIYNEIQYAYTCLSQK